MKHIKWYVLVALMLIFLSAVLYTIQIVIFQTPGETFFLLLQDLAFIPIEVFLVSLVISELLSMKAKRDLLKKLNMVIGVFFSEVGISLLDIISKFGNLDGIKKELIIGMEWTERNFQAAGKLVKRFSYKINCKDKDLQSLQDFLLEKREFMLSLLENPNLLEHDSFTDLLWSIFHLMEEFQQREDIDQLPDNDYIHLNGDMERALILLINEWIYYMKHLKAHYPYLFSFAVRKNPFDPNATVIFH